MPTVKQRRGKRREKDVQTMQSSLHGRTDIKRKKGCFLCIAGRLGRRQGKKTRHWCSTIPTLIVHGLFFDRIPHAYTERSPFVSQCPTLGSVCSLSLLSHLAMAPTLHKNK